jgi:hypothetical protein
VVPVRHRLLRNTISSSVIVDLAAPDASTIEQIAITLGNFAVFALPAMRWPRAPWTGSAASGCRSVASS